MRVFRAGVAAAMVAVGLVSVSAVSADAASSCQRLTSKSRTLAKDRTITRKGVPVARVTVVVTPRSSSRETLCFSVKNLQKTTLSEVAFSADPKGSAPMMKVASVRSLKSGKTFVWQRDVSFVVYKTGGYVLYKSGSSNVSVVW